MSDSRLSEARTLTTAVRRAAACLAIEPVEVHRILQIPLSDAEHLLNGTHLLSSDTPEWDAGLMFVRLADSLLALTGNEHKARSWLTGVNAALGAVPAELLASGSIDRVVEYVEQARYGH